MAEASTSPRPWVRSVRHRASGCSGCRNASGSSADDWTSAPTTAAARSSVSRSPRATGPAEPEMPKIRVLVVDDHTLFRQGIVGLLDSQPDVEVVGQAA